MHTINRQTILLSAYRLILRLLYVALCSFALVVTAPHMQRQLRQGFTLSWPRKDYYIAPEWGDRNNPLIGISSINPPKQAGNTASSHSSGFSLIHPNNPLEWLAVLLFVLVSAISALIVLGYALTIYDDWLSQQRRLAEISQQLRRKENRRGRIRNSL